MHAIEIHVRSDIDEFSADAAAMGVVESRVTVVAPQALRSARLRINGNWRPDTFVLSVPDHLLERPLDLSLHAFLPRAGAMQVTARAFRPESIDLVLKAPNRIEAQVRHQEGGRAAQSTAELGCTLTCPGANTSKTGSNFCIECRNARGAIFKICC